MDGGYWCARHGWGSDWHSRWVALPGLPTLISMLMSTLVVLAMSWQPIAQADVFLVEDQTSYNDALARLSPGDELVLADGTWSDFQILFEAQGQPEQPITLRAQTPGKVVISGRSNLRIAGEHLVVAGLRFSDGYSPTRDVIAFRRDEKTLANHTRLTEVAIEDFSKPDRTQEDQWVTLYGKHNRVDHSYFAGKTNKGPTIVVRLNTPSSRENEHSVDHNYFGHRPSIGGNGGETLRIGVSDYSRTQSQTSVVENLFEHCDGEVEIISIKAEGNRVTGNLFYESRGAVVFRHGGNNEVSRNVFFGNGVADTGGVRVINDRQTVKENYFEGLRGEKFLSALTIMNGVPNSPINRYHQVKDAEIASNSFIGFDAIGLAVGSDEERSAAPLDSQVSNNLFITEAASPVSVFDDISGIGFADNASNNAALKDYGSTVFPKIELARAKNGLLYPTDKALAGVGAPRDLKVLARNETGPSWFVKPARDASAIQSREIRVGRGASALRKAVQASRPGDILKLRGRSYAFKKPLLIPHALTIDGRTRNGRMTKLTSQAPALFHIPAGGALTLSDTELVGGAQNKGLIRAIGEIYRGTYSLRLSNVVVSAAKDARPAPFLAADDTTFATLIELKEVSANAWPGAFIALSGKNLQGWYLAEDIKIHNSTFTDIAGALLTFGREGRDESTFGPRVLLQESTLKNVNTQGMSLDLQGIDGVSIRGNEIRDSGVWRLRKRVLGLGFALEDNRFINTPDPKITGIEGEPLTITGGSGP